MLKIKKISIYVALIIAAMGFMAPIYAMLNMAFKTMREIVFDPWGFPFFSGIEGFVENLKLVWFGPRGGTPFYFGLINSFKITIPTVFIVIIFSILLAYPLARYKLRLSNTILTIIIIGIAIPHIALMIPIFKMVNGLGLYDTIPGLIWVYVGFVTPFSTFLFRNYMTQMPMNMEEAARIDGASSFQILTRIIIPLCKPVIAVMIIFAFTWVINDFFYQLLLTNNDATTATVFIALLTGSLFKNEWSQQMTASLLFTLPTLIVFLGFQRYFIKGIMLGSVKG
jgi:multiple sugar transport system permease protein